MRFTTARRLDKSAAAELTSIYESSFAPDEREPADVLLKSIEGDDRVCFLAQLDETVLAFAIVFILPSRIRFLEY
ncbi:MAG TPA: hypothetical protein VJP81_10790, partial [Candidatus Dormibacteraeota bacterium]|nr:hypothetical protein [Candidatus Dormibacteraeota bacterium]